MQKSDCIIGVEHVSKFFGDKAVLNDVNLSVRKGEFVTILGPSGCGKTTLLKLIEGEVELEKRDSDEDIYIAKSGNPVIGYLKQIAFADETISMETEVRKVFEPYREKQRELEAQRQIMESDPSELNIRIYTQMQEQFTDMGGYYYEKEYETMLRKFGFTEADKKKPLREFSGGQQTKLGFIKMLLSKPDILLLDEPLSGLDNDGVQEMYQILLKQREEGKLIVVASHSSEDIRVLCNEIFHFDKGKMIDHQKSSSK